MARGTLRGPAQDTVAPPPGGWTPQNAQAYLDYMSFIGWVTAASAGQPMGGGGLNLPQIGGGGGGYQSGLAASMGGLANDPELGPILRAAAAGGWSDAQFQAALVNTNWYRNRSEAARDYDILAAQNPAELQSRLDSMAASVKDMANMFGLSGDFGWLTTMAVRNGFNEAQVRELLANAITMDTVNRAGLAQQVFNTIGNVAAEYFFKVDDETKLGMTKRVASGELEIGALATWAQSTAKQKYGHLANIIDQGTTLRQYFNPHRLAIAELLEISPDEVDFINEQRWQQVVRTYDPKDGAERAMTIYEAEDHARQQEEWRTTDNAKANVGTMVSSLGKTFGLMG